MENIIRILKIKRADKFNVFSKIIGYYFIIAVLLFSGIAKILDPVPLINTLKLIIIIPENIQRIIATLLPVLEIGLAVLMLTKIKPGITLTTVTVLFTIFLGFSIYGTTTGLGTDCGYLPANLLGGVW